MDLLENFKSFLFSQDNKASKVTVKNYISDINHFVRWYESSDKVFDPSSVTKNTIDSYKTENSSVFSPSSLERHLSSLRKFFSFLKSEGKIASDPFKTIINPQNEVPDPFKIKDFKNHLYTNNASHLTIKNYLIDIKQFMNWAEEVIAAKDAIDLTDSNILNYITKDLIDEYKSRLLTQGIFSPSTINRKLSSLRKYFAFAQTQNLIRPFSFETSNIADEKDEPINIPVKSTEIPVPVVDSIRQYSNFPPLRLLQKISNGIVLALDLGLVNHLANIAEASEHLIFKIKGNPVFSKANKIRISKSISLEHIVGVKNLPKELYAPLEISTKYFPWYKKLWHTLRYKRPKWYATYHSYAIVHYFHFAVLLIFIAGLAVGFYNGFVKNQSPTQASVTGAAPLRILSFQGRLTDSNDNPITSPTYMRFMIYNDLSASGSARLWEELRLITPDADGIFNSVLGSNGSGGTAALCNGNNPPASPATGSCGIMSTLFANNNALYLGVTVTATPELTPRQQIATVAFASNSETLQGLLPTTDATAPTANAVLALDSSGNLTIGGTGPTFQATSGQFTLSGQPLLLTTNASSNSNVQIAPNGLGVIDLQKPLQNTSNNNNIASALGAVEVDDLFAVLATSGGQSAFTVNQNGLGPIFSASAGGLSKFTVKANGELIANNYGTCTLKTDSTGLFTCGTDLTGTGGFESPFRELSGSIVALNITNDFLFGSQASISARFKLTANNLGAGTLGVASISGKTSFATLVVNNDGFGDIFSASSSGNSLFTVSKTGNVQVGTYASQPSQQSNGLVVSGNLGIATNAPAFPLDVNGIARVGTLYVPDGTKTAPSIARSSGTNTGFYFGTNFVAFTHTNVPKFFFQDAAARGFVLATDISLSWAGNTDATLVAPDVYFSRSGTNTLRLSSDEGNGAANLVINGAEGIGTTSLLSTLDVRGNSGITSVASVSGQTSFAALVANNNLVAGDLFTASSSSQSRFTIKGNGAIIANAYPTCTLKTDATGLFTCGTDLTGTGGFESPFRELGGAIVPLNSTEDFLIGGQATTTAKFAILGVNGARGTQTASLSGSLTLDSSTASIQSTNNQFLTLGGNSTGDIQFKPGNSISSLYLSSNGNVGVGTTAPATTLDIRKDVSGGLGPTLSLTNANSAANTAANIDFTGAGSAITRGRITFSIGPTGPADFIYLSAASGSPAEKFRINYQGRVGINNSSPLAMLDAAVNLGTISVASFSGSTSLASVVIDQSGVGDIFTASKSGAPRFTIAGNGGITANAYQNNGGILFTTPTGLINQTAVGNSGECLKSVGGGTPTFGTCSSSTSPFSELSGAIVANNTTEDFLFGSQASISARFKLTANNLGAGTLGVASISGKTSFATLIVNNDGVGDIFSASSSGNPLFTISKTGNVQVGTYASQPSQQSNGLVVSGSVGIGVNNPNGKIEARDTTVGSTLAVFSNGTTDMLTPLRIKSVDNAGFAEPVLETPSALRISSTNGGTTNQFRLLPATGDIWFQNTNNAGSINFSGLNAVDVANVEFKTAKTVFNGNVGIRTSIPVATLDVRGGSGIASIASLSGSTNIAGFVIDNSGTGDLFTASKSGGSRFTIAGNGAITANAYPTCTLKTDATGLFTCGTDLQGSSPFSELAGAIVPNNSTEDFLIGGQSTASATFHLYGNALGGTSPVASIAANTSFAGLVVDQKGVGDIFTASKSGNPIFTITKAGNISVSTHATDIIGAPTTANMLRITDGTTALVSFDSRTVTTPGIVTTTFNPTPHGVSQQFASNTTYSTVAIPGWTWSNQTTSVTVAALNGVQLNIGGVNLNGNNNTTVTTASSLYVDPPTPNGVAITNAWAIHAGGAIRLDGNLSVANQATDFILKAATANALRLTDATNTYAAFNTLGTAPVASLSGRTSFANLVVDQSGVGDIFTASKSGAPRFTIAGNGGITANAYQSCSLETDATGLVVCGVDDTGASGFTSPFRELSGAIVPLNSTEDFFIGGQATTSAQFSILNIAKNQALASVSGQLSVIPNTSGWGGQVGINTPATGADRLSVAGSIYLTFDNSGFLNNYIRFEGGATGDSAIQNFFGHSVFSQNTYARNVGGTGFIYDTTNPVSQIDLNGGDIQFNTAPSGTAGTFVSAWLNKLTIKNIGTVGINTTTPLSTLDVRPNISTGGTISVASVSGKTSFASLVVDQTGVGDIFTASASGNPLFTITKVGNVGIGTTTPAYKLDVSGDVALNNGSNFYIRDNGGTVRSVATIDSFNNMFLGGTNAWLIVGNNATGVGIGALPGNPGSKLSVHGSGSFGADYSTLAAPTNGLMVEGNVGIGTTSAIAQLHIAGAYGSNAALIVNQLNSGDIFTASASGIQKFSITNAGGIRLGTNEGTVNDCLLSGGTGAAASFGSCAGAAAGSIFWNQTLGALYPKNSTVDLLVGGQSTTSADFAVLNVNGTGPATASVSGNLIVMPKNGAGGQVGIGTTNPAYKLDVTADSTTAIAKFASSANGQPRVIINANSTSVSPGLNLGFGANDVSAIVRAEYIDVNNQDLSFWTNGSGSTTEKVRIQAGGNVGIGTTNPQVKLTVGDSGTSAQNTIRIYGDSASNKAPVLSFFRTANRESVIAQTISGLVFANTPGLGNYNDATLDAAVNLIINNSGNIGLGTNVPNSELYVTRPLSYVPNGKALVTFDQIENQDIFTASASGTTRLALTNTGALKIGGPTFTTATQATGLILGLEAQQGAYGIEFLAATAGGGYGSKIYAADPGTGITDLRFATRQNTGSFTDRLTIRSDGNVGIGTILPTALLDIVGTASVGGQLTFRSGFGTIQTTNNQLLTLGGNSTGDIQFKPGNSSTNLYLSANGNVGIGTTNPGAKLDVKGGDILTGPNSGTGDYLFLSYGNFIANAGSIGTGGVQPLILVTGSSEKARITPTGTFGIGTTSPLATLDVRPNTTNGGTIAIASVSGRTSFAALITNNDLVAGDLFTASSSSQSRFTIKGNGQLIANAYQTCTLKTDSTGLFTCGTDNTGTAGFESPFRELSGAIVPLNSTEDFLFGSQATSTARFRLTGSIFAGTNPVASIAANTSFGALVIDQSGVGDIFSASKSGNPLFTISKTGNVQVGTYASQPSQQSNGLVVSGNVGIGTNSPEAALHVNSAGAFTQILTNPTAAAADVGPNILFAGNANPQSDLSMAQIQAAWTAASTLNTYLAFQVRNGGALSEKLRLNNKGDLSLNTISPLATLDIRPNTTDGGTIAVASVSGATSFATLVVNNDGVGDIFTASKSGAPRFTIAGNGAITANAYQNNGGILFTTTTGLINQTAVGNNGECLKSVGGGTPAFSACAAGSTPSPFSELAGAIVANNTTEDFLLGSQATATARFRVTANTQGAGTTAVASISGKTSFATLVVDNDGVGDIIAASVSGAPRFAIDVNGDIRTYGTNPFISANGTNTLTLNNNSTGNIQFFNNTNTLDSSGNLILASDLRLNGNDILDSTGTTRINLGATTTFTNSNTTFTNTSAFTANSLNTFTTSTSLSINPNTGTSMVLDTSALTLTLAGTPTSLTFGGSASTLNIGPAAGAAATINLAGGSGATGCTVDGATGNFTCSGNITSTQTAGVQGFWSRVSGLLSPSNITDSLAIGGSATTSSTFQVYAVANGTIPAGTASTSGDLTFDATSAQSINILGGSRLDVKTSNGGDAGLTTRMSILPNGTFGFGTIAPLSTFDVRGVLGTSSVASVSGTTSLAAFVINNNGVGDLFSASKSGGARFTIKGNGQLIANAYQSCSLETDAAGVVTCGVDDGVISDLYWNQLNGSLFPNNSSVDLLIGGQSTASARFRVTGNTQGAGTLAVASISGNTSFAALVANNDGVGDIFTASKAGSPRFTIAGNGGITANAYQNNGGILFTTTTGLIGQTAVGNNGECLKSVGGGTPAFSACSSGGGNSPFTELSGSIVANNQTEDFLFGGQSTTSARFRLFGSTLSGNSPVASISAKTIYAALVVDNQGTGDLIVASSSAQGNNPGRTQFQLTASGTVNARSFGDLDNPTYFLDPAAAGTSLNIAGDASASGDLNFSGASVPHLVNILDNGTLNFATSPGGDTVTNSRLFIQNNGNIGIGTTAPLSTFDVRGTSGTINVASFSGQTSFAALVVNNNGVGDLFSASKSGGARFTIAGNGGIIANAYINNGGILYTTTTGLINQTAVGNSGECLKSVGGGAPAFSACGTGGSGNSPFTELSGAIVANNSTEDFLFGGQSTASAKFRLVGSSPFAGTLPVASIAAKTSFAAFVIDNQSNFGDLFTASASGATRFVITNNGRVGIGTTNPQAALDIAGSTSTISNTAGDITIDPTANLIVNGTAAGGSFGFNTGTPLSSFDIRQNGTVGGTISVASVSGKTAFAALVVNNDSSVGDIFAASASGATRFRIAQNGSVLMQGATTASIGNGPTASASAVANGIGDSGSLIPNASFESKALGAFADGWYQTATGTATLSNDSSTQANGESSLKVVFTNTSTAVYSTCVPITGNNANSTGYVLNYYAKVTGTVFSTLRGYIDTYGNRSDCLLNTKTVNLSAPTSTTALTTSWAQYGTGTKVTVGNDVRWGKVRFFVACISGCTNATVNIDGVRMTQLSTAAGLDYAENYPADPNNIAEAGDIVSVISGGLVAQVKPTDKNADDSVLGIVSTKPGEVLDDGSVPDPKVAVALAGRVPVKVSVKNGPIHTGDMLQSSEIPGVAVKALSAGPTVAVADEDFDGTKVDQYYELNNGKWNKVFTCDIHSPNCQASGKIIANIKMSYYNPAPMIASIQEIALHSQNPNNTDFNIPNYYTLNDRLGNPISKIDAFLELAVGNLKAGFISARQITTNSLTVASENISINGLGIRAYIASIVSEVIDNLNGTYLSPIASVDQIHTNLISPLDNSSNISLDLSDSKLTIRNGKTASSSAVASIDNAGNATFSGTLAVGKDASIAGTLRAGKIIADEIEGLNIKSATIAANYITNNVTNVYNSTPSSSYFPTLSSVPTSSYSGSSIFGNLFASNNSYINIATYSSQLAYVENFGAQNAEINDGLMVFGPTSLSDTSIVGQLSVNGSLILANNSINTLGSDLSLQPLRQGGLSIMAGLIYVDTNGNIRIKGDATIEGNLYANVISPIPGKDLSINLPTNEDSDTNPILKVKGASNSAVLSVNGFGDLVASGEATFGKLNVSSLVSPALAVSPTEVVATGSAGTGIINPHQTLITIDNKLVTPKSLIYITPTSNTNNQVLFLLRQIPGKSFTVGVQNQSILPIPFNWIIIN